MRRALFGLLVATVSCGELSRLGTSSSYLVVESFEAASGADGEFHGDLESDVMNGGRVGPQDPGRVTFSLGLKDPGPAEAPNSPSPNNAVTLNRYRVRYVRADGRNTPGLDVPHPFDGAFTLTVSAPVSTTFALVRTQAKAEAPLAALSNNPQVISTIAEVTFYGRDQTGRAVSADARISVHFANWPDRPSAK